MSSPSGGQHQSIAANVDRNRRMAIQAVYKDKSLSAQEKKRRMEAIMNGEDDPMLSRVSLANVSQEPSSHALPSTSSEPEIEGSATILDSAARKRAIKAIYLDTSLSGLQKQRRIQAIMAGVSGAQESAEQTAPSSPRPSSVPSSPPPSPPMGEEGSTQRRQISAVYKNAALPALEKKRRVKVIISTPPPKQEAESESESKSEEEEKVEAAATDVSEATMEEEETESRDAPPMEENRAATRRSMIVAVHKDSTLSAAEKQEKIQDIMKEGAVTGNARGQDVEAEDAAMEEALMASKEEVHEPTLEPQAEVAGTEVPPAPVATPQTAAAAERRQAILAVHKDQSLTPAEKQKKIQDIMKDGTIAANPSGVANIEPAETYDQNVEMGNIDDDLASLITSSTMSTGQAADEVGAIQDIVNDRSLSAVEKYKKISQLVEVVAAEKAQSKLEKKKSSQRPGPDGAPFETVITPVPSVDDGKPSSSSSIAPAGRAASAAATAAATSEARPMDATAAASPLSPIPAGAASSAARDDAASNQRTAIQAIYRDQSLSAQEKHRRVQALMAGKSVSASTFASASTPVAASAAAGGGATTSAPSSDDESENATEGEDTFADEPDGSRTNSRSYDNRTGSRSHSSYTGSRSSSRSYSSRSGSYSDSRSGSSYSRSSSYTRSDQSAFSDEQQNEVLIDADVAPAKPEGVPTALAEQGNKPPGAFIDEDTDSEFSDRGNPRRRLICCVLITLIILGAVGGPLLYHYWSEVSEWWDDLVSGPSAPASPPPTTAPTGSPESPAPSSFPSSAPTTFYPPNTPEECAIIAQGGTVPGQENLINKSFDISLDVSLTVQLSDLDAIVQDLENRMQEILAVELADCPAVSRRLSVSATFVRRRLIESNVVGNALIDAEYQEGQSCDPASPTPCIRVLTKLNLFLKGDESILSLVNRISTLFGDDDLLGVLGLGAPFEAIEVIGVSASTPTLPPAPTASAAPTQPGTTPTISSTPTQAPANVPTNPGTPTQPPANTPTSPNTPTQAPANAPAGPNAPTQPNTPTQAPANAPNNTPTEAPNRISTKEPTRVPTRAPVKASTKEPTRAPVKAPTKEPTQAPSIGRQSDIENALQSLGDLDDLVEDAVEWLLEDDEWLPDNWEPPTPSIWLQRYVLAALYEESKGYAWDEDVNWMDDDESICDWFGVTCDGGNNIASLDLSTFHWSFVYSPSTLLFSHTSILCLPLLR
eukprot:scaffold725_cov133-Cylindrotheca_fusiformis.AAC.3